jgi:hypothetical protein
MLFVAICITFSSTTTAATPNYSVAISGVQVIPVHISGQYTATTDPVAHIQLPFPATVIGVSATARASGGTSPTLTVDIEDDGTSILSSAISVTAGTVSEGTIATASVADESQMEVVLTIGGTSPTWDDITVLMTVIRQ